MFTEFLMIAVACVIFICIHQLRILIPINKFLKRALAAIDLCIIANYIGNDQLEKEGVLKKNGNVVIKADVYKIEMGENISEKELLIKVVNILKDAMEYAERIDELKQSEEYEMLIFFKKELTMKLWEKHGVRPCELL